MKKPNIDEITIKRLVAKAREGSDKSFLTKPNSGTRYGASVVTGSGDIYSSGQYSSFNHITNIHAEMSAILLATMNYDADVHALAVVSNKAIDSPAKMCGGCREFINEHSQRIGHDILVIFSSWDGAVVEKFNVNDLLPSKWVANKGNKIQHYTNAWGILYSYHDSYIPVYGDLVEVDNDYLALVWENNFVHDKIFVKYKYSSKDMTKTDRKKIPHSFSEYPDYYKWLSDHDRLSGTPIGEQLSLINKSQITGYKKTKSLQSDGLAKFDYLLELFQNSGIKLTNVSLTGSRVVGLEKRDSDYDIVVKASVANIRRLQKLILKSAKDTDKIFFPVEDSNTIRLLQTFPKFVQDRFFTTFSFMNNNNEELRCSLIFVPSMDIESPLNKVKQVDRYTIKNFTGTIIEAENVYYKRAMYRIKTDSDQKLSAFCWHKLANLIQVGDTIQVSGLSDGEKLFQLNPNEHGIKFIRGIN